jgi:hypothetical protein
MPYEIVKEKRGFRVKDDKNRFYSKKLLTKKVARQQQKALYAAENQRAKGRTLQGGIVPVYMGPEEMYLVGDGWITNVFAKIKDNARKVISKFATPILNTVSKITTPLLRKDFPPKVRQVLERYGDGQIYALMIMREPIANYIDKALNFISAGKWDEAKKRLGYDKMFHLSMIALLNMPDGQQAKIKIEKNEVINITDSFTLKQGVEKFGSANTPQENRVGEIEVFRVPLACCITLNELMDKAAKTIGDSFFTYDAFTNNCQIFLNNILTANGINTPEISAWILQPADGLLAQLPSYVSPFARVITNVAGLADLALEGRGEGMEGGCMEMCGCGTRVPIRPRFRKQLKKVGISPEDYLAVARDRAEEAGYDPRALEFSTEDENKLQIYDDEGKVHRFGAVGYNDFILWSTLEALGKTPEGQALKKQNVFWRSHTKIRGDWKDDRFSPNMLALKILW